LGAAGNSEALETTGLGLHRGVEHRPEHDHDVRRDTVDAGCGVSFRRTAGECGEMVGDALRGQFD